MNSIYVPTSVPTTPVRNRGETGGKASAYRIFVQFYANFSFVKEVYGLKIHETEISRESKFHKMEIKKIGRNIYRITEIYGCVVSLGVPNVKDHFEYLFKSEGVYTNGGFIFKKFKILN